MAIDHITKNVALDADKQVIYVNAPLDDADLQLVELNKQPGWIVKPMPKRKKSGRKGVKKAEIMALLTAAQQKEFDAVSKEQGYFAAQSWAKKELGDKYPA